MVCTSLVQAAHRKPVAMPLHCRRKGASASWTASAHKSMRVASATDLDAAQDASSVNPSQEEHPLFPGIWCFFTVVNQILT